MIKSIFGLDTQDIMQKRAEDISKKALLRTKAGDIDPTVAILGESLGNVLGRGLLSKLGYEDKEMSKALLGEQFTKDIKDKIASGELDPASKDYNLLMARYYGQLGDSQNQLRQMELFRIKENDEFAKQDKIAGRYVQLVSEFGSHEEAIKQLEAFYPGSDFSKLKEFNTQSDVDSEGTKPTGLTTEQVTAKGIKEEWNGAAWTEIADINTARGGLRGGRASTSPSAIVMGGEPPPTGTTATEEWNTTSNVVKSLID